MSKNVINKKVAIFKNPILVFKVVRPKFRPNRPIY